jgi:hypothetical protein
MEETMKFPGLLFVITNDDGPCVKRENVDRARVLTVNELILAIFRGAEIYV